MNDTNVAVEMKMRYLMGQKSSEERLEIGCSMYMFAKTLVKASFEQGGTIPVNILRQKLFIRFYGDEFEDSQKNKIMKHLGNSD